MEHLANDKDDVFPNDNDIILIDANKAVILGAEWSNGASIWSRQLSKLHLENIFQTYCLFPWQFSSCVIFQIVHLPLQVCYFIIRFVRSLLENWLVNKCEQIDCLVFLWDTKSSDRAASVTI